MLYQPMFDGPHRIDLTAAFPGVSAPVAEPVDFASVSVILPTIQEAVTEGENQVFCTEEIAHTPE